MTVIVKGKETANSPNARTAGAAEVGVNAQPLSVRGERTRNEIIAAAVEVFAESGESRTSLTEVARRCGRSSQAIYRYFPGRRALFEAAVAREEARYSEAMRSGLADVKYPMLTGAQQAFAFEIVPREFPLLQRIYRSGSLDDLELLLSSPEADSRAADLAAELRLGQAAGVVRRDIDPGAVASSLYRVGVQVLYPRVFGPRTRPEDIEAVRYLLRAAIFSPVPELATRKQQVAFVTDLVAALDAAADSAASA